MTMATGNMYDHTLDVVRGAPAQHRLDYVATVKSGESFVEGAVVSVESASGLIVAGCGAGSGGNRPMPMFAIRGTGDLDVVQDAANISGGEPSAVVATGGFEVRTSEFVTDVYRVNDLLTPATGGNVGKVARAAQSAYGSKPICGVVSTATAVSEYAVPVLSFWTTFLPAGEVSADEESSASSNSSSSQSTN